MRSLNPFAKDEGSPLATYAARMAETTAVRRARLEARAAQAEAERFVKARSDFLANMNHELRTPLNAIIGFASMLREGDQYNLSADQRRSYTEYILQSADLLLGHINTILEVADLDRGEIKLQEADFDLANALREALVRAETACGAAKVSIEDRTEDREMAAWGDPERMGQAIDHVIRTAIKLSEEGGRIAVRAARDQNGWPEIAIRDRGEGFTPEGVQSALNAFRDMHRGLDRSFAGPGVGLAIAKTFVEMQGGRFHIKSRPNEGTLVRIALTPARGGAAAAGAAAPAVDRLAG